jgi:hypothetical protein
MSVHPETLPEMRGPMNEAESSQDEASCAMDARLAAGGLSVCVAACSAEPAATPAPSPMPAAIAVPTAWSFSPAPIGSGGGFVVGLDIAADGSRMVCDTDVFNGYIRGQGDAAWQLLLRADNLPRSEYEPLPDRQSVLTSRHPAGKSTSTFSTRIAPSDPDTIYTAWNAQLYRSDDGGVSFVPTVLPPKAFLGPNGFSRLFTRSIDVHPTDPGKVLVGTNDDGCYYSADGFRESYIQLDLPNTARDLDGIPAPYLVAFGPDGTPYVHVFGTGLYSAPAGLDSPFVLIGGPKTVSCLTVCPTTGAVYLCETRISGNNVADAVHVYRNETWTRMAGTFAAFQVAVDPFDPDHLIWVNENGGWHRSRDGGVSKVWDDKAAWRGQGESDWVSNQLKTVFPSQVMFDPVVQGRVWVAEGVGINYFDIGETYGACPLVVHDKNNGIQELLATTGLSVEGQRVNLLGVWDKGVWRVTDDTGTWHYCPVYGQRPSVSAVAHLRSIDYASDDTNFLVGLFNQDGGNGYSEDFGQTWTPFPPPPPGVDPRWKPGGDVAVSTRNNIVIAEGNNGGLWYTRNGGLTTADWHPVSLHGNGVQEIEAINAAYTQRDCLTADKTRPGVFAFLHNNLMTEQNPDGSWRYPPDRGIWVNTKGGEGAWTQTFQGVVAARQFHTAQYWQARLAYIPGRSGELLYAAFAANDSSEYRLVWMKNDGAGDLIELPPYDLKGFDFGKPLEGQDYPSLWFWGVIDGAEGLYVTFDWFASEPLLISTRPGGVLTWPDEGFVADKNTFGRCYFGMRGYGWLEVRGTGESA